MVQQRRMLQVLSRMEAAGMIMSILKEFVPVVHVASEEGRKVQVYFNNHPKGNGARNAKQLKEMLLS